EEQWRTGVNNVRELGKYAADLSLQIALELEPFKLSLVNNVDTMSRFLDDVNHPAVRANIDVSHLQLSGVAPVELRRLVGKAIHLHRSDWGGKVHGDLPPGRGVVDFPPYLQEIKNLGIDGAVSIELEYSPQPEKIVEWVREAYEATDRLMRQAGLRGERPVVAADPPAVRGREPADPGGARPGRPPPLTHLPPRAPAGAVPGAPPPPPPPP